VAPVDNANRLALKNSRHPLAQAANDQGRLAGSVRLERIILAMGRTPAQEQELQAFLDSQHDPTSPNFRHWLTPAEFGRRFGATDQDVKKVSGWLAQQGLSVSRVAHGGGWIEFSGTVQQVETAFQTQMHRYQVGGATHIANAAEISMPAALLPAVRGVVSLHNFHSKPFLTHRYNVHRNPSGQWVPNPDATFPLPSGTVHVLTPSDYATIYGLNDLYSRGQDGSGQTIAIVARSNVSLTDIETFRQIFNLPPNDPKIVIDGLDPGFDPANPDASEAMLDVEWSGAVAPNATIDVVVSASTLVSDGVDLSAAFIVDNNLAGILSESFGLCEAFLGDAGNAFDNALFQQAAAQGISVFVSSGDDGAAGCAAASGPSGGLAVSGLASTPFATAVGGTTFSENGNDASFWDALNGTGFESAIGYIPEAAWNESCDGSGLLCQGQGNLGSTGGGASAIYAKPAWQTGLNVPADGQRDVPDVALTAAVHDGYLVCLAGACQTSVDNTGRPILLTAALFGGTSAATPSFAGIIAVVEQKVGSRLGLINPMLYKLAAADSQKHCDSSQRLNPIGPSHCVFNDITSGNNNVLGLTGFDAGPGYDLATGLGSVNAANLALAFNRISLRSTNTVLSANGSTSIQHGAPISLTIGVKAQSGSGVPSGLVSLITDQSTGTASFQGIANGNVTSGTLANGTFTGTFNSLPGGKYNVIAHYSGDGTFGASDSNPIQVNIAPESSLVALRPVVTNTRTGGISLGATVAYGDSLNALDIHGVVSSASGNGAATGQLVFSDRFNGATTQIASMPLNHDGEAEIINCVVAVCLTPGTHVISASYPGDSSLSAGTSAGVKVTITPGLPLLNVFVGEFLLNSGQQLQLETQFLNVGTIPPTGTIQYLEGQVPLGSVISLAQNPKAAMQVVLPDGPHQITASYSGDQNYNPSTSSPPLGVEVDPGVGAATQTAVTLSANSINLGDTVNYTVTVTGGNNGTPTGTIKVVNAEAGEVASATLQDGSATIPVQWPFAGSIVAVAEYFGDDIFAPSGSVPIMISVAKATAPISLLSNADTVSVGDQVSITANLQAGQAQALTIPGGLVQFFDAVDGGSPQILGQPQILIPGNQSVTASTVTLPAFLPIGTHVITAQYGGDNNFNAGAANGVNVQVVAQPTFQLSATGTTSATVKAGESANFNLVINPNGFSGTITFACSGAPAGATCAVSPSMLDVTAGSSNVALAVTVTTSKHAHLQPNFPGRLPFALASAFVAALVVATKRRKQTWAAMMAFVLVVGMSGCVISPRRPGTTTGSPGGSSSPTAPKPTTANLTITGTGGGISNSVSLTLTVNN
jgi:hypothetical protein